MYSSMTRAVVVCSLVLLTVLTFPLKAFCGKFPGEISAVKGTVEVKKAAKNQWFKAVNGLPVQLKDKIRTQKDSSCNLELDDGSLIFVDENTEASVEFMEITSEKHSSILGLWAGRLLSNIKKTSSTKMSIKCPTAVISVRGTEFAVEAGSAAASVGVFSGEVAVSSASEKSGEELEAAASTEAVTAPSLAEVSVKPGEETTIDKGESPKPPTRLSLLMQKNAARMNELRGRAQELREKLKRVKPEYLDKLRQETLDRVTNINEKRNQLRERIKEQREQVK